MTDESTDPSFEELLAWSMDAEPELLPYLPALFADMEELGARVEEVLRILGSVELPAKPRMLDLGCGKGAVGLALLEKYDGTLHGIDGIPAFLEHAEHRAESMGLTEQSIFAEGDVRDAVLQSRDYDLVCLLALGDVFGSADQTVAALRECVKPGGYILIDDAYIRDGDNIPEDTANCFDHQSTTDFLRSCGDEIVAELEIDGPETAAHYDSMTAKIAGRVEKLAKDHPEAADLLHRYVQRQRDEVEVLSGPVVGALWLIRRVENAAS